MTLVDTSAWIEFLRIGGQPSVADQVTTLLDRDEVAICGIVEMELLQGVRPREARRLEGLVQALHYVDLVRADYVATGARLRRLREHGVTVPASDALVAVAAIRRGFRVLAADSHFAYFPELAR